MKLRNKKTGETFNAIIREYFDGDDDYEIVVYDLDAYKRLKELPLNSAHAVISDRYKSLAELNEEWEDYAPKEPLIKDEKTRKAVRAWADVNDIERVWHEYSSNWLRGNGLRIELENGVVELEQGNYSIEELCGEETPEPLEPSFIDLDERIKEEEPRPVIANGVEYDSYADYLKSREEEE